MERGHSIHCTFLLPGRRNTMGVSPGGGSGGVAWMILLLRLRIYFYLFIYYLFVCLFFLCPGPVSVKPAQRMNNSLLPPPSSLRVRVISSHPPHRTPTPAGPARPPPNTAPTPAANSYGTAMRWDGSQSICTATPTSFRFGWPALAVQQNIWLTRFRPALSSGGGEFREGGGGGGALSWRRPTSPPVKETLAGVDPLLEGRG